jgi:hypothetical protein
VSNIPRARKALTAIAQQLEVLAAEIDEALYDLNRRPPARKPAPRRAPPVGAEMAEFLREFARANPKLSQAEIAQRYGINPGRVAEALHGDR